MSCQEITPPIKDRNELKKVLLMGNPNVGKSVLFNRLTGLDVITANYSGTTVSYHEGVMRYQGEKALLIDVPGTYSLKAVSKAEEVATRMLDDGADLIICVLDATHLERNLHLAFDIQKRDIPIIFVLNLGDVAFRRGLEINKHLLSKYLNAPVIETVAVKRIGINELKKAIFSDSPKVSNIHVDNYSEKSEEITNNVVTNRDVKLSFLEKLGDASIKPLTGIPIAIIVMTLFILFVVRVGEFIVDDLLAPLLENYYIPFIENLVARFVQPGLFYNVLVGEYGLLIKMIEWPIAVILPFVLMFYIAFSFLEDSGYLPRLGVLLDSILRKIGLPGNNIIPFLLGYGCAVPAILSTRAVNSSKERVIVVTLIAIAVPCTAQTAALIVLLGSQSIGALIFVYSLSFLTIILIGLLLNRLIKGKSSPLILEIPNLLMPDLRSLSKKVWVKMKHFIIEAQVPMFIGILVASLAVETGALETFGVWMEPLVVRWLDLPKEASLSLVLGIIRRELAVVPLLEMNLTTIQLITGSVVALFYLPCISVLVVLFKEFKFKVTLLITLSTFLTAFIMGGLVRIILNLIM
ncbi:FeoB small GTPase domain-containing protein [Liberiplasma polymorphum]|uniref:FeoB small GTPase domain-containing protein n=1 Tax=Liberiplasma polymorphum TaxID=3374570 RepID=UPI0037754923